MSPPVLRVGRQAAGLDPLEPEARLGGMGSGRFTFLASITHLRSPYRALVAISAFGSAPRAPPGSPRPVLPRFQPRSCRPDRRRVGAVVLRTPTGGCRHDEQAPFRLRAG